MTLHGRDGSGDGSARLLLRYLFLSLLAFETQVCRTHPLQAYGSDYPMELQDRYQWGGKRANICYRISTSSGRHIHSNRFVSLNRIS